ncbi:MAG: hypothetical protein LBU79_09140, partial [Planctomycetota bacterium]|nr:hypothetical protein [Planctomycetota bacterium]
TRNPAPDPCLPDASHCSLRQIYNSSILEVIKVAGSPAALEKLFFIPMLGQEEGQKMSATTIDDIKAKSAKEGEARGKLENIKTIL